MTAARSLGFAATDSAERLLRVGDACTVSRILAACTAQDRAPAYSGYVARLFLISKLQPARMDGWQAEAAGQCRRLSLAAARLPDQSSRRPNARRISPSTSGRSSARLWHSVGSACRS